MHRVRLNKFATRGAVVERGTKTGGTEVDGPLKRVFPVVGVGASAGGLEAFTQLLAVLPNDTGMAFVLVQHLDPTHTSLLAETLAKATKMEVSQAEDGARVKPNHVYIIPPNADISIVAGAMVFLPRNETGRKLHLPIDFFSSFARRGQGQPRHRRCPLRERF